MFVEQTNALCHCKDCVGFAHACPGGDYVIDNHATHLVNYYKSDIKVVKGQDKIRRVRLYENTVLVRTYCSECGTPLGADVISGPITLLYQKLLTSGPVFVPTIVLARKHAPHDARPYCGIPVARENFSVWFLIKVVSRVLLGFLLGKHSGGLCGPDYDGVPVGLDKIEGKKKS